MRKIKYFEVRDPGNGSLRYETVFQKDAQGFAGRIYRETGVICDLNEVIRKAKM